MPNRKMDVTIVQLVDMASKKYIKDYDLVESEDGSGRVKKTAVYQGDYFHLKLEESQIKSFRRQILLLFMAACALHIGAGFINNPGLNRMYAAIPYTAAFFPLVFLAAGILRIPNQKRPYRNEEIGLSYKRIINMSRLYLIFMAIGIIGILIYLVFAANLQALDREAIYSGLVLATSVLIWIIFRKANEIEIEKEETPVKSE